MNKNNPSNSELNYDSAKQIQGLADLLTAILTQENEQERQDLSSTKKNENRDNQSGGNIQTRNVNAENIAQIELDNNPSLTTIDIPVENKDNHKKAQNNSSSLQVTRSNLSPNLSSQLDNNSNFLFIKSESKFNAKNDLLETEVEELRKILVGLESRIYDHQELINLLLPAVTETIRDKINQREGAINNIFKPGEGKTITEQIEYETELIMDALYPVIGTTIGNYIATTVGKINSKVVNALDNTNTHNQDLKIKVITSEDLNNQKSNYFQVKNVFLIHKKSHLVIAEKGVANNHNLSSEMLTNMLTSIRNLSYKFTNQSDFLSLEYGNNYINICAGNYAYLAVISEGNAPTKFLQLLADTLAVLEKDYETCIKSFQGDLTIIPDSLTNKLEKILEFEIYREIKRRNRLLIGGCLMALFLITVPYGIYKYLEYQKFLVSENILEKIDKDNELGVYNLDVKVNNKQINLTGKLPNNNLKEKLTSLVQKNNDNLTINNQVSVVDLPVNETEIKSEIKQVLNAFNQIEGIEINTKFENGILQLTGEALQVTDLAKITESFAKIEGIEKVNNEITIEPLQIPTRIYFSFNSDEVSARDIEGKLSSIKQQMQKYPQVELKITGYRSNQENYNLGLKRAENIKNILEDLGIDRRRLMIEDGKKSPPDIENNSEKWLSQAVIFELQQLD